MTHKSRIPVNNGSWETHGYRPLAPGNDAWRQAIWAYLNDEDKVSLRKMLIAECDWLLNEYPIEADPVADTLKTNLKTIYGTGRFYYVPP